MKAFTLIAIFLLGLHFSEARDFRTFTNTSGKSIEAELLDMKDGVVKIRRSGKVFEITYDSLSKEDQDWLTAWDAKRQGDGESLYYSELIFEDDFSGEGFGEKWSHYKSESLVQEGVLIGKTIDIDDHAGVDAIRMEGKQDLEVSVKFNFMSDQAERFNVWLDDKDYKGSHAGHICSISFSPTGGNVADAKTGAFENAIYEMKKSAAGLDEDTKKMLEGKTSRFELDLDREEWHTLLIRTKGDAIEVQVNGDVVCEFQSEGIAHSTKSQISLTTNINDVHYDDFSIRAAKATAPAE